MSMKFLYIFFRMPYPFLYPCATKKVYLVEVVVIHRFIDIIGKVMYIIYY